jgi:2-keto-4-pentenoate hydratase
MRAEASQRAALAEELAHAFETAQPIEPLGERAALDVEDAYAIQRLVQQRFAAHGDEVVGRKIGLSSKAMQRQLGVAEPDYGPIWASWQIPPGGLVRLDELIAPRLEVEVAAILARPLVGERVSTLDVLGAVDAWAPAIEIVDSRIRDWRITIVDTIADHASGARFVVGQARSARSFDPASVGALLLGDGGEVLAAGNGRAVLGHPAASIAWLARALARVGDEIPAGAVVLSGAMHAAVPLVQSRRFVARLRGLGEISVEVEGAA